jgi:type II secretory pathway pseudopilin PulG
MVSRRAQGFTYFAVLFVVALIGVGLALTGEIWQTAAKREKEAELLFIGHQYRKAIERYYLSGPQRQYPRALEDLLKDPRALNTQRHLRRLYPDPFTGKAEWGLVKGGDGGIAGVHSLSTERPLKIAGFRLRDAGFERAQSYADWKFAHSTTASSAPSADRR